MAQFISKYSFVYSPGNCFSYNIQLSQTFFVFAIILISFVTIHREMLQGFNFFSPKRGPNEAIYLLTTYNLENISDMLIS
jgi:hypothetical protein